MSSVFLASHREKLVSKSFGSDGSFCDPVDEHRKRSCNLVGVRVVHEENSFMHCIVSDKAARIAKFLHLRGKLQAKNLCAKIVPFSFKVDTKPFKRKAQHRACAAGRATDDRLSLHVRSPNIVRHVFARRDGRKFRPHKFPVHKQYGFPAGDTGGGLDFVVRKELKAVFAETNVLGSAVASKSRNDVLFPVAADDLAEQHLGIYPAVRARKNIQIW